MTAKKKKLTAKLKKKPEPIPSFAVIWRPKKEDDVYPSSFHIRVFNSKKAAQEAAVRRAETYREPTYVVEAIEVYRPRLGADIEKL